jgi:hypothetical protein
MKARVILAIAHLHREPDYWIDRLSDKNRCAQATWESRPRWATPLPVRHLEKALHLSLCRRPAGGACGRSHSLRLDAAHLLSGSQMTAASQAGHIPSGVKS